MRTLVRFALAPALLLVACATPPKPTELDAFEKLKASGNLEAARRRAPELTAESDRLLAKSRDEWQSNDLYPSRRDALMGSIKLKTALALVEQDQSRARAERASKELAQSEEELGRVNKELAGVNEQVALLQKLKQTTAQAAAEQQRMQQQITQQQQQSAARDKLAAAELSLKSAETVDAQNYAKSQYQTAQDTLARAEAQYKSGDFAQAVSTAEMAKDQADRALKDAKPSYESAEAGKSSKARNEALAADAAGLPGVQVRLDRRGEVQRLALPLRGLFIKKSTSLAVGSDGVIDGIAGLMKKYPTYPVMVVGYTDNRGKRDDLLALSQARATAVYSALVSRGVEAKRLVVSGMGGDEAVSDNRTTTGRAQNNRIEIIFLYQ
jgi:outer membrane protein OmpA-like peptidoglycan-associated protein